VKNKDSIHKFRIKKEKDLLINELRVYFPEKKRFIQLSEYIFYKYWNRLLSVPKIDYSGRTPDFITLDKEKWGFEVKRIEKEWKINHSNVDYYQYFEFKRNKNFSRRFYVFVDDEKWQGYIVPITLISPYKHRTKKFPVNIRWLMSPVNEDNLALDKKRRVLKDVLNSCVKKIVKSMGKKSLRKIPLEPKMKEFYKVLYLDIQKIINTSM